MVPVAQQISQIGLATAGSALRVPARRADATLRRNAGPRTEVEIASSWWGDHELVIRSAVTRARVTS